MLTIRDATIKDATRLSWLLETSYRFHFSYLWHDQDELEEYIAGECSIEKILTSLQSPDHKWFIAESQHAIGSNIITPQNTSYANIVGFSKIILNQPVPDKDFTGIYLHKLYLMPKLTRQKYGDHLSERG
ncbi:hypothetical protein [Xenorhabdus sp. TS4]|uniref:hypothetical protein n=1 Tax=Xenorhabdus sp. TS4 TaxID=1873483 RepID=UPI002104EB21|nr:hypothetical protein [Xenorhabdus sp. TS4]MBC8950461.1 GNAT family acetyltransferase [Xenorhabdus sp. TS4]